MATSFTISGIIVEDAVPTQTRDGQPLARFRLLHNQKKSNGEEEAIIVRINILENEKYPFLPRLKKGAFVTASSMNVQFQPFLDRDNQPHCSVELYFPHVKIDKLAPQNEINEEPKTI